MGNFMIPVCCVCGKAAPKWHDAEWEAAGGLQDFCPKHAKQHPELTEYLTPHMDLGALPKIPEWAIRLFFWLAIVGLLAVAGGAIAGLWWLIAHLHWA